MKRIPLATLLLASLLPAQQAPKPARDKEKALSETQKLALAQIVTLQQELQAKQQAFAAEACAAAGIEITDKDGGTCQIDPRSNTVFRQQPPPKDAK